MGKLIVFEGTDGSGKSTQFARLCALLDGRGVSYEKLVFPQYDQPSSALIRMYLGGEFGSRPGDVNAYAASAFFAVDRYASMKKVWGQWYQDGGLVLTDRYTTSNAVHQAAKLPPEEQADFCRWLADFEYGKLGLPRPDAVFYLDMPTELSVRLLRSREQATHTAADIHEVDTAYLAACRDAALRAAGVLGWTVIPCAENGRLRGVDEIHVQIKALTERILGL